MVWRRLGRPLWQRQGRRLLVVVHDIVMVALALSLAFVVAYDFAMPAEVHAVLWQALAVFVPVQGIVLWWAGLYRGVWRFASIPDLQNIVRAVVVGILAGSLVLFIVNRLTLVPRSSLLLYPIFLALLLGGPRVAYRMWTEHRLSLRALRRGGQRVLILGAGRAGEMLAREMLRDDGYQIVGFLDDRPSLLGSRVQGVPILGRLDEVEACVAEYPVDLIVIAIPTLNSEQMRRVVHDCERCPVPFRTLPDLREIGHRQGLLNELRDVSIEDLLGREAVRLDWRAIETEITGARVLISGGGGSIGSELSRQVARLGPAGLVIFENNEYNLYRIERELRETFPGLALEAVLGDVRDHAAIAETFGRFRPEIVFHAAAYKHVPMLESQVREAVKNNVLGTRIVADAADRHACRSFVMISTDKAVNPSNVMGASKRISEIYCQGLARHSETRFMTVRFGNVLGSTGSVVPLFREQIRQGGPVTVTHPEITRYFMTIPEACQLILQAAVMGRGGEIFVLEMGEPVKIAYLAEQMIRLSGKRPGEDIEIVYTGLRPGEKMYEELFYEQERLRSTAHEKILLAESAPVDWQEFRRRIQSLIETAEFYDSGRLTNMIWDLIPRPAPERAVAGVDNIIDLKRART